MREFPIASMKPGNSSLNNSGKLPGLRSPATCSRAGEREVFPLVTVIMPVRNEEKFLRRCMDSLLGNDYPPGRLEILVADGMSNDRSREILAEYSERFPFIRVLDNPGRIVPIGLNEAIRQAKGDIIVRVDAHTVFAPDYIRQ